jgi:hypothetical protein
MKGIRPRDVAGHPLPERIEESHAGGDHVGIRRPFPLAGEALRVAAVIGIHARQPVGRRGTRGGLERADDPGQARICHQPHPGILAGIAGDNPRGAIARAVIHGHQFPVPEGLGEQAFQRFREGGGGIVKGQQDGNRRSHHSPRPRA